VATLVAAGQVGEEFRNRDKWSIEAHAKGLPTAVCMRYVKALDMIL